MGDQAGKALWTRPLFWKSAVVIAPLAAAALFLASGTQAQTSGNVAPSASGPVAPIEIAAAARRKGPKIKEKEATNDRVANPPATTDPVTPAQTGTPVAPIGAPDAARTGRPKIKTKTAEDTGRAANPPTTTEPVDQPTERRRKGPKGDSGSDHQGRTETPAPDTQPTGRRRKGPKGASDSGRTSTTPLIIGALGAAAILAVVVSSGNDRPASP